MNSEDLKAYKRDLVMWGLYLDGRISQEQYNKYQDENE